MVLHRPVPLSRPVAAGLAPPVPNRVPSSPQIRARNHPDSGVERLTQSQKAQLAEERSTTPNGGDRLDLEVSPTIHTVAPVPMSVEEL